MLSDILKDLRRSHKLTQTELAKEMGVTQQAVGMWERNKAEPTAAMYKKLARYFGVPTDILMCNETTSPDLSVEETELVEDYRRLSDNDKDTIRLMTKRLQQSDHNLSGIIEQNNNSGNLLNINGVNNQVTASQSVHG